ncbi:MAG: putative DNA binding domain-containing protein [Desulfohalobiaceae bacterium]|nr:putative DNA binding domain-containing protein [Desulfohalobiaceae bacterium]
MYDDIDALLSEISAGEDTFLELKEVVLRGNQILIGDAGRAAPEIAEVFCSIANTEGGVVVFGVRKDGAIVGIQADKRDNLEQFVVNVGLNNCRPIIEPILNWMQLPDENQVLKLCLKVDIPKSRYYVHQTSDGRFLKRVGSHRHPIPPEQLGRLLAARNLLVPFEERPALGSDIDIIDPGRIEGYYQNRFKRSFSSDGMTYERLLVNWKLADESDGRIVPTNLGVILFSERPERVLNGAYIDIAAYRGTIADGETSDTKHITGPVPEQILQVLRYFQSSPLIATLSRKEATGRRDLPAYVDIALQEAVVNAVVHREYELTGSQIIIRIFQDRIEFQNPGGLHNTLTAEALYTGCQPVRRNQLLSGFMRDFPSPITGTSFMEARGEGFLNLVRDSEALSGRRPKIEQIGQGVKLTVYAATGELS